MDPLEDGEYVTNRMVIPEVPVCVSLQPNSPFVVNDEMDLKKHWSEDDVREAFVGVDDVKNNDEDNGLPIDRDWAWVIAIAAHLNACIIVGYMRAMGIFFLEFLREFQTSVTMTTLVYGVMFGVFGVTVFIVMQILVGRFQVRYLVITGTLLSSTGVISSVFARNVTELIATQGVLFGLGSAMIHGPALVLLGKYFKTRRGLATSIANSGISSGAVIFPPLVRYLLDSFGLRGALLIVGGLQLNMLVFGLLLRPVESFKHKKKVTSVVELKLIPETQNNIDKQENSLSIASINIGTVGQNIPINNPQSSPLLERQSKHRKRTLTEASKVSEYHSQSDVFSFVGQDQETETRPIIKSRISECFGLFGLTLWKNPLFVLLLLCNGFGIFLPLFLSYYPAFVAESGTSDNDSATFLSIAGALDFFSRLGAGYFADFGYVKRTHICVFTLVVSAINCQFVEFYTSYWLQLFGAVVYGLFGGVFNSFLPVLLMDLLGVENLSKSLGFVMVLQGIATSIYHPIIGSLKDLTGSYSASYHCMGSAVTIAAVFLVIEPLFKKPLKPDDKKIGENGE